MQFQSVAFATDQIVALATDCTRAIREEKSNPNIEKSGNPRSNFSFDNDPKDQQKHQARNQIDDSSMKEE